MATGIHPFGIERAEIEGHVYSWHVHQMPGERKVGVFSVGSD